MVEILKNMLSGHNQFASGGLLLMIVGGLGVYLRAVPEALWRWFVSQTTMMVTVKDDDAAFVWVKEWLLEQKFLKKIRHVDLDTTLRGADVALIPAPGTHWFWRGRRPFVVYFHRSEDTKGWLPKRSESLTFRTVGRNQEFLKLFVDEIAACHERKVGETSSLYVFEEYWARVESYRPRLFESVILKSGEKEHLTWDIERFKRSAARYRQLGVPYHRGYLLYGPPGTGKTSLVSAIAARFDMSIYAVNLADFNDRTLMRALNDVPGDSVILFEDIDCMKSGKARSSPAEAEEKKRAMEDKNEVPPSLGVTLSGLLNALDGFSAPDNVLFVMTSNRVEVLDPALLRPGRIDYKVYLGQANEVQKIELYKRFFPDATDIDAQRFVENHRSVETMAEFQGLLLKLEQDCTELNELVAQF
jgi:chaperone BCS1